MSFIMVIPISISEVNLVVLNKIDLDNYIKINRKSTYPHKFSPNHPQVSYPCNSFHKFP